MCIRDSLYTDKMEIHIVELPKLKKYQYPETELLRWARFFNAENKEEMQMAVQGDKYMEKAYNRLVNLSADDEKRLEYEERQKAIRDYNHMINSGWRTGHARGYAEGHAAVSYTHLYSFNLFLFYHDSFSFFLQ